MSTLKEHNEKKAALVRYDLVSKVYGAFRKQREFKTTKAKRRLLKELFMAYDNLMDRGMLEQ